MIAIDPGAHPGFAVFDDEFKELIECGSVLDESWCNESRVVYEHPVIYPRSPVDPNRILTLAVTAGRLVERAAKCADVVIVPLTPRSWKGQLKKTSRLKNYIVYKRVLETLNAFEKKELQRALGQVSEKDGFDIVDAIGIGLFDLKRL